MFCTKLTCYNNLRVIRMCEFKFERFYILLDECYVCEKFSWFPTVLCSGIHYILLLIVLLCSVILHFLNKTNFVLNYVIRFAFSLYPFSLLIK